MKVAFTIFGEPASKANSRQIVMIGRGKNARPSSIKSEKAREYERAAQQHIPDSARVMFDGPVRVTVRIFYATQRPDLDESVVLDVLQAKFSKIIDGQPRDLERAGVYVNDRQVREKHVYHGIDRDNPRAEIEVEPILGDGLFADALPVPVKPKPVRARSRPAPAPMQEGVDPF